MDSHTQHLVCLVIKINSYAPQHCESSVCPFIAFDWSSASFALVSGRLFVGFVDLVMCLGAGAVMKEEVVCGVLKSIIDSPAQQFMHFIPYFAFPASPLTTSVCLSKSCKSA
jgi:hypothetical protein